MSAKIGAPVDEQMKATLTKEERDYLERWETLSLDAMATKRDKLQPLADSMGFPHLSNMKIQFSTVLGNGQYSNPPNSTWRVEEPFILNPATEFFLTLIQRFFPFYHLIVLAFFLNGLHFVQWRKAIPISTVSSFKAH